MTIKKIFGLGALVAGALLLVPSGASAHCDSLDGPVATAAIQALATGNINLVLPYAPAEAEAELSTAYRQAMSVRGLGGEAKALVDRYFMETAVRLHRLGEHAAYTGLKPAGQDFGPAIPATEKALTAGRVEPLVELMSHQVAHGIQERFAHAQEVRSAPAAPKTHADVAAARKRVSAELELIGYVQGIHGAIQGAGHAE